jgi:hypothetical protein
MRRCRIRSGPREREFEKLNANGGGELFESEVERISGPRRGVSVLKESELSVSVSDVTIQSEDGKRGCRINEGLWVSPARKWSRDFDVNAFRRNEIGISRCCPNKI